MSGKKTVSKKDKKVIPLKRIFTKAGIDPLSEVKWVLRDAVVGGGDRKVFEQKEVEFPGSWSLNAVNITVAKYFRGKLGTPAREKSLKQMITRVTSVIRGWGEKIRLLRDREPGADFRGRAHSHSFESKRFVQFSGMVQCRRAGKSAVFRLLHSFGGR